MMKDYPVNPVEKDSYPGLDSSRLYLQPAGQEINIYIVIIILRQYKEDQPQRTPNVQSCGFHSVPPEDSVVFTFDS